jgi:hypothetical protein
METLERMTMETRTLPILDSADLDATHSLPVNVSQDEPGAIVDNNEEDETGSSSDSEIDEGK